MEWSELWPELEFWAHWPSIVTGAIAVGALMIDYLDAPWKRTIAIIVLAFLTMYGLALTNKNSSKPERDYAYYFVIDGEDYLPDGKVKLYQRATGPLSDVTIAFARGDQVSSDSYEISRNSVGFHEGTGYAGPIEADDWHIDIDPLPRNGQVKQRLYVEVKDGKVITKFARVQRKFGNQEILCETPKRKDIPKCE